MCLILHHVLHLHKNSPLMFLIHLLLRCSFLLHHIIIIFHLHLQQHLIMTVLLHLHLIHFLLLSINKIFFIFWFITIYSFFFLHYQVKKLLCHITYHFLHLQIICPLHKPLRLKRTLLYHRIVNLQYLACIFNKITLGSEQQIQIKRLWMFIL